MARRARGNHLRENATMTITRRHVLAGALRRPPSSSPVAACSARARTLKISHQFPGGTVDRRRLPRPPVPQFAAEVEKRTNGWWSQVYPGSSLMKTNAQFSALRKGALDIALIRSRMPAAKLPRLNIGLMPGAGAAPTSRAHAWKKRRGRQAARRSPRREGRRHGRRWIWQAGGVASRAKPLVEPDDAKGMKVRGGSREMDMMLQGGRRRGRCRCRRTRSTRRCRPARWMRR